jgi:hypothetical protein
MTPYTPPHWMERLLRLTLATRDRETISGDLLEEYREAQVPGRGRLRANLWYLRQVADIAVIRLFGGAPMKYMLAILASATLIAGAWLGIMELLLQHPGYFGRAVTACCIIAQAGGTLFYLRAQGQRVLRAVLAFGGTALAALGLVSIHRVLHAAHFEGFVLLIGAALILQCIVTLVVLFGAHRSSGLHHA